MADSSERGGERRPAATLRSEMERSAAEAAKFAELRALLVGPEQRQLHDLKTHLADKTARTLEVSGVLPEAIARSAHDPDLARALTPPIEQAISAAARRDPQPLAEALFPVVGRSVRKLLGETLTPLITLGAAVLLVAGVWAYQAFRERQRWDDYLSRLNNEPGVVVVQSGRRNGKFFVTGLRDELAVDPSTLVAAAGLAPEAIESRWEPYQAIHPPFVVERARAVLRPPESVALTFRDGTLTASGRAAPDWIADSERLAPAVLGVRRFEFVPVDGGPASTTPAGTLAGVHGVNGPANATSPTASAVPPPPAPNVTAPGVVRGSAPGEVGGSPAAGLAGSAPATDAVNASPGMPAPPPVDPGPPAVALAPGSPEQRLVEQIDGIVLSYADGQIETDGSQEQTLRRLTTLLRELNEVVHLRRQRAYVEIVNHPIEGLPTSAFTARRRANSLRAQLRSAGFDAVDFVTRPEPITPPANQTAGEDILERARRLSFSVRVVAR